MNKLIVPIVVEALLSNGKTSDHKRVPMAAPDYKKVSYTSFLGSRNTPGDFQLGSVLRAGVHLHFILPSTFTRCGEDGYPAVPNRYLLTRLYKDEGKNKIVVKCFIIESDYMSTDKRYSDNVTIPRFEEKNPRTNWRYLGRSYSADRHPATTGADEHLERLTAVGAGDPLFAAYYPSCSSVFGFYDDMAGVPLNTSITYFVMGYFSDAANDPLVAVKSEKEFQQVLSEMNFSVGEDKAICDSTVLFGEIFDVVWKGTQAEYSPETEKEINIAVGNTSAEALSAAVTHAAGAKTELERFLTALQYELADSGEFEDGNYKIDDEIMFRQFDRLDGEEEKYALVLSKNEEPTPPSSLGERFSEYCVANSALAELRRRMTYTREKLFYSWEQYMLCYEDPRFTPKSIPAKAEMLREINRVCTEELGTLRRQISEASREVALCRTRLDVCLAERGQVTEIAPEPFYLPKDPVLLLSGPGVKRTYAFGEDGRFTADGTLLCQTDVVEANVKQAEVLACLSDTSFFYNLPEGYQELLYQATLLDANCLVVIEKRCGMVKIAGGTPSRAAVNSYHSNPITLFMAWEAEYFPTRTATSPDSTLEGWYYAADETMYRYKGGRTPSQLTKQLITGRTVMTPHAVIQLSDVLRRWLENHSDRPEIAAIAEKVKNLGVISQNLDGFTKALSMRKQTFQFPIIGAGGDEELVGLVAGEVSPHRDSVMPDGSLFHLRGGYFGLNRLSLVGTFGQLYNVSEISYFGKTELCFSEALERFDHRFALLPPAFASPVRLNFRFVSARDEAVCSSPAPETSPIFGIVLPELLNRRLMVYQADGRYIGSVNTAFRDGKPRARWSGADRPEQGFEDTPIADERLRSFILPLLTTDCALPDMLVLMDAYYENKLIPSAHSFLWGRPFVLARCRLGFEFLGGPEFVKAMDSFGKYNTLQACNISFPVLFGGMRRAADGVLGCYSDDYGFGGIAPAFGAEGKAGDGYLLEQNQFCISQEEGAKGYTLLMEPHATATLQTGLMPLRQVSIDAAHSNIADHIFTAAEVNPILSGIDILQLPLEGYEWRYTDGEAYLQGKTSPPVIDFGETVVMDGYLVKEEEHE